VSIRLRRSTFVTIVPPVLRARSFNHPSPTFYELSNSERR